jgi:hypothetical protein
MKVAQYVRPKDFNGTLLPAKTSIAGSGDLRLYCLVSLFSPPVYRQKCMAYLRSNLTHYVATGALTDLRTCCSIQG